MGKITGDHDLIEPLGKPEICHIENFQNVANGLGVFLDFVRRVRECDAILRTSLIFHRKLADALKKTLAWNNNKYWKVMYMIFFRKVSKYCFIYRSCFSPLFIPRPCNGYLNRTLIWKLILSRRLETHSQKHWCFVQCDNLESNQGYFHPTDRRWTALWKHGTSSHWKKKRSLLSKRTKRQQGWWQANLDDACHQRRLYLLNRWVAWVGVLQPSPGHWQGMWIGVLQPSSGQGIWIGDLQPSPGQGIWKGD